MTLWLTDSVRIRRSQCDPRRILAGRLAGGLALTLAAYVVTLCPVRTGQGQADAAMSLVNLAATYCREGDTARAIETYEQALSTQPNLAVASRNLGLVMLARNNIDRAFRLFSDAARDDPADPYTHAYLGETWQRQGKLAMALGEFRKAVSLAPGRVEFRLEVANALLRLGDYPHALAQYDTLTQLAPDNPAVHQNYAVCLYNVGRLDEARLQLEAARRLGGQMNPGLDCLLYPVRRSAR
jgi:tetratricopeptide (TPR) repeat protein